MFRFEFSGTTGDQQFWGSSPCGLSLFAWIIFGMSGCATDNALPQPQRLEPKLAFSHYVAADGAVLPVRVSLPSTPATALIIAIHGFNDYSRAFEGVGTTLRAQGLGVIAYDQRGFGLAEAPGAWAGSEQYQHDLRDLVRTVHAKYPGIPLFLLGESMGAAVVITTLRETPDLPIAGAILSAPAVWSRETMPWYQRLVLQLAASTFPDLRLTGSGLKVQASDNIEMLRGLGRDPWVIKATRIDAIEGLVDLMDAAQSGVIELGVPVLVLYGGQDQIIPEEPIRKMLIQILQRPQVRAVYYSKGFHLLLRDLSADLPLSDVTSWIHDPAAELPSGCELRANDLLKDEAKLREATGCLSGHSSPQHLDAGTH
jgi:alpha-beta hydrolase superfamily lysophospholipase